MLLQSQMPEPEAGEGRWGDEAGHVHRQEHTHTDKKPPVRRRQPWPWGLHVRGQVLPGAGEPTHTLTQVQEDPGATASCAWPSHAGKGIGLGHKPSCHQTSATPCTGLSSQGLQAMMASSPSCPREGPIRLPRLSPTAATPPSTRSPCFHPHYPSSSTSPARPPPPPPHLPAKQLSRRPPDLVTPRSRINPNYP